MRISDAAPPGPPPGTVAGRARNLTLAPDVPLPAEFELVDRRRVFGLVSQTARRSHHPPLSPRARVHIRSLRTRLAFRSSVYLSGFTVLVGGAGVQGVSGSLPADLHPPPSRTAILSARS